MTPKYLEWYKIKAIHTYDPLVPRVPNVSPFHSTVALFQTIEVKGKEKHREKYKKPSVPMQKAEKLPISNLSYGKVSFRKRLLSHKFENSPGQPTTKIGKKVV